MDNNRSKTFRVIAILVAVLATEGSARLGLSLLATRGVVYRPLQETLLPSQRQELERIVDGTTQWLGFDHDLGWTIRPHGERPPLYQANAQGLRADREFALEPPNGVLRVAAFGDSFTYGDNVAHHEAWSTLLQSPSREVLNFGVPAYGLDQAYLRYRREGRRYHAQIVLIGFMGENIFRSVSVYRPFYLSSTGIPLAKPRFRMEHDTLVLIANPMRSSQDYQMLLDSPAAVLARLGTADYFYRTGERAGRLDVLAVVRLVKLTVRVVRRVDGPLRHGYFNAKSEAFRLTLATMDRFVRDVRADGATPLIVLFPPRQDLSLYWKDGTRTYDPLRSALDSARLPYVDLVEAFEGCSTTDLPLLLAAGHYTAAGNARVAAFLADRLTPTADTSGHASRRPPDCDTSVRATH